MTDDRRHCSGCQKPKGVIATHQMGTIEHPTRCHICGMDMGPDHTCGGSVPR